VFPLWASYLSARVLFDTLWLHQDQSSIPDSLKYPSSVVIHKVLVLEEMEQCPLC